MSLSLSLMFRKLFLNTSKSSSLPCREIAATWAILLIILKTRINYYYVWMDRVDFFTRDERRENWELTMTRWKSDVRDEITSHSINKTRERERKKNCCHFLLSQKFWQRTDAASLPDTFSPFFMNVSAAAYFVSDRRSNPGPQTLSKQWGETGIDGAKVRNKWMKFLFSLFITSHLNVFSHTNLFSTSLSVPVLSVTYFFSLW